MTFLRARPLDFLEALGVDGRPFVRNRRTFGLYARQVAGTWSWTIRDGAGRLCAICGLWREADRQYEAFFVGGEALRANLIPVLWLIRAGFGQVHGRVTAYIDPAGVAGDRLASVLGFQPCGLTDTRAGPLRTWRRTFP